MLSWLASITDLKKADNVRVNGNSIQKENNKINHNKNKKDPSISAVIDIFVHHVVPNIYSTNIYSTLSSHMSCVLAYFCNRLNDLRHVTTDPSPFTTVPFKHCGPLFHFYVSSDITITMVWNFYLFIFSAATVVWTQHTRGTVRFRNNPQVNGITPSELVPHNTLTVVQGSLGTSCLLRLFSSL